MCIITRYFYLHILSLSTYLSTITMSVRIKLHKRKKRKSKPATARIKTCGAGRAAIDGAYVRLIDTQPYKRRKKAHSTTTTTTINANPPITTESASTFNHYTPFSTNNSWSFNTLTIESTYVPEPEPMRLSATNAVKEFYQDADESFHFEEYAHQLTLSSLVRWRDESKTVLLIPKWNSKKQQLYTDRYHHVVLYEGQEWVCDQKCYQFSFQHDQTHCDHTLIAMLLANHNPTGIRVRDFHETEQFCCDRGNARHVYASLKGQRSTLFSIELEPESHYSFVHLSQDEKHLVCSRHKIKGCPCRDIVLDTNSTLGSNRELKPEIVWDHEVGFAEYVDHSNGRPAHSLLDIPVPRQYRISHDHTSHQEEYDNLDPPREFPTDLYPKITHCTGIASDGSECGHALTKDDALPWKTVELYSLEVGYKVDVHFLLCPACNARYDYDGLLDRIFCVSQKVFVYHSVFLKWEHFRAHSTLTQDAFVKNMAFAYTANNSPLDFVTAPSFAKYDHMFLDQTAWSNKLGCTKCKGPSVNVSFDATGQVVSFDKVSHIIGPKESFKLNEDQDQVTIKMKNLVSKIELCYLNHHTLRKKLTSWLIATDIAKRDTDENPGQHRLDFPGLIRALRAATRGADYEVLIAFLVNFNTHYKHMNKLLVRSIGDFLRCLSSHLMLDCIVPWRLSEVLASFSPATWGNIKDEVRRKKPQLWLLIVRWLKSSIPMPDAFITLLRDVASRSHTMVCQLVAARNKSPAIPLATDAHQSVWRDYTVSGCNYATYEVHHIRPKYDHVSETRPKPKKKGDVIHERNPNGDCHKNYLTYKDMSNGVVIFLCADHHEVIGWHVLKNPESVNDCFSLLLMMYPGDEAPEAILCDNACALHKYCMIREPTKFRDTLFINDDFHAKGHKCGPYYSASAWKDCDHKCPFRNDSEIEQINATLDKSRLSCRYMALKTFAKTITRILEIYSRKQINKRNKS